MEGDCDIDDKFVAVNKLNGYVLKIGDSQGEVLGKIRFYGGENNDSVGNGLEDRYKHDWQHLILAPSLC